MSTRILKDLKDNFEYTADGRKGYWKILSKDKGGKYRGDCEDYALTALYMESGSWFKFWLKLILGRAKLVHCKSPGGNGHAILKYNGLYIDNIQREWTTERMMKFKGYKLDRFSYLWHVVVIKLATSKLGRQW